LGSRPRRGYLHGLRLARGRLGGLWHLRQCPADIKMEYPTPGSSPPLTQALSLASLYLACCLVAHLHQGALADAAGHLAEARHRLPQPLAQIAHRRRPARHCYRRHRLPSAPSRERGAAVQYAPLLSCARPAWTRRRCPLRCGPPSVPFRRACRARPAEQLPGSRACVFPPFKNCFPYPCTLAGEAWTREHCSVVRELDRQRRPNTVARPMRTCLRGGRLPSLRAFRPFTSVPPRPHARAAAVANVSFASSRRRFAGAALLAAGLMFSGRPRGLAASAAQQSVDKVWL